ncbi:copper homeostasis protein CutC [Haematococcus lacustris]|uniref:Copper homeostasis protein cutC homolog n=1 Tax=Haematococcus lacustris TaxID=44745 RepID=A0A699ZLX3_HAELA|nr:copper homeostasis protein CutC [Haematococcus lacustris]
MPGLRAAASPDGAASGQTAVVEICIDSVASAEHARQGGAQRVELCANLHEGGVTPSAGMIKMVRQAFPPPGQLMVLIRCRGGDFLYSPEELTWLGPSAGPCWVIMAFIGLAAQAAPHQVCSQLGADGVVLGCLTATGEVDSDATATLMRTALIKVSQEQGQPVWDATSLTGRSRVWVQGRVGVAAGRGSRRSVEAARVGKGRRQGWLGSR